MTGSGGTLRTQSLFAMLLSVDGFLMAERPDGYARRIANVPGGSFEGTQMSGIVLPVGNAWQALRSGRSGAARRKNRPTDDRRSVHCHHLYGRTPRPRQTWRNSAATNASTAQTTISGSSRASRYLSPV
jgi:hypothetical protein